MAISLTIPKEIRSVARFGSGVGIEIGAKDLEVVATRVRPRGVRLLGRLAVHDFAARPASEWGSEYARFLAGLGAGRLSATVALPRREIVVRHVSLPNVSSREMESAIRLQLETLHPYGDSETRWGWSPLGKGAALVAVALRSTVERYATLFAEAGVAVENFTCRAAALHAAISSYGEPRPEGFVAIGRAASGGVEVFGESPARPIFSTESEATPERAAALAIAELRLPVEAAPVTLLEALPSPDPNSLEIDVSRSALAFAAALAGACPWLASAANVLPPENRRYTSRTVFAPTAALVALLVLLGGGAAVWSRVAERSYLSRLRMEIARLQPIQQRGLTLDRDAARARDRARWLDDFRSHTQTDLSLLKSLTDLIQPPAWASSIDITRDSVRVQGEARQAASLWKIIDASGLFKSSSLDYSQPLAQGGESFLIRATREGGQ